MDETYLTFGLQVGVVIFVILEIDAAHPGFYLSVLRIGYHKSGLHHFMGGT